MKFPSFQTKLIQLPYEEQEFLKILSIAFEPVSQSNMMSILQNANIRDEEGQKINATRVREMRSKLDTETWINVHSNGRMSSLPSNRELIMRIAIKEDTFGVYLTEIRKHYPYKEYARRPRNFEVCISELRVALYTHNTARQDEVLDAISHHHARDWQEFGFFKQFFLPFDAELFDKFGEEIKVSALKTVLFESLYELDPIDELTVYLEGKSDEIPEGEKNRFIPYLHTIYLLKGHLDKANKLLLKEKKANTLLTRKGWIKFLEGSYPKSLKYLDEALLHVQKSTTNPNKYFKTLTGLFHVLAILKNQEKGFLQRVDTYVKNTQNSAFNKPFAYLGAAAKYQLNFKLQAEESMLLEAHTSIDWLFWGFAAYWTETEADQINIEVLEHYQVLAGKNDYPWIRMELSGILSKLVNDDKKQRLYQKEWKKLNKQLKVKSVLKIVPVLEKWERSLDALLNLNTASKKSVTPSNLPKTRLVYYIHFKNKQIQPKEQTLSKNGKWSAGRNVALKRLSVGGLTYMTAQDLKVAKAIDATGNGWGQQNKEYHEFNFEKAIKALVDHPLLFLWEAPTVSVELKEQKPELIVEEEGNHFEIKFSHPFSDKGIYLTRETPTRYNLLSIDNNLQQINNLLDKGKLRVPKKAKDQIVKMVSKLSNVVTIQSVLEEGAIDIPAVVADPRPCIHMLPIGAGFKIEFFVKPYETAPPYFKPGVGRANVITEIKGVRTQTKRDLKAEKDLANEVVLACPSFKKVKPYNGEWLFDDIEDCLNVMVELDPLHKSKSINLEHPKGEKIKIVGEANFSNLSIQIKKENDWFGITGKLNVNDKHIMDFQKLLSLVDNTSMRFVEVSEGKFLAITNQLRSKLREINSMVTRNEDELQFHSLAAPAMEGFTNMIEDIQVDAAWNAQLKKLEAIRQVQVEVPSTFKAVLRDYQERGFQWLTQLADWGVGACLADDMGLGKTIQALALIVSRAEQGATLIVAPASVARNWLRETEKFAPSMNPLLFGQGDRREMVTNLKPFDIMITSYGLMQTEAQLLSQHNFTTIVLDEAQAIKNRQTKRSKTAMKLQGDFKILTTGTPIENHLGEIWNLFNFINPGLLGSLDRFNNSYAVPIEKNQDMEKRQQLKRLLQPFILRRRKNDVLSELPEKTEVTLMVELSEEERSFYEALRRNALEKLATLDEDGGQKRFQILAELMRMRQAACHPRLVLPHSKIQSSKMQLLKQTVSELIENGHKALIFSQFVKHLRLIEEWVQSENISYQYLDGQTPLTKREKSINAFQEGEGDLFLISLKAGGVGLNLTAADYVIHLDPWWNPAVEDQASDRAHRIGQKRPVTIYRLVSENTIEEKIVQLHADKRNLADSLLEGTEASAKLSAADLLALIKGEY